MKTVTFIVGLAAGVAVAATAVTAAYPDISRRLMRDSRRAMRCGKRAAMRIGGMFN